MGSAMVVVVMMMMLMMMYLMMCLDEKEENVDKEFVGEGADRRKSIEYRGVSGLLRC